MDGIHTKSRNSLSTEKVTAAAKIKFKFQRDRAKDAEDQAAQKQRLTLKRSQSLVQPPSTSTAVDATEINETEDSEDEELSELKTFDETKIMEAICDCVSVEETDADPDDLAVDSSVVRFTLGSLFSDVGISVV